jgi:triacylglycerol esterase/lipase EstA (alpha/beta hydrolase family)
MRKQLKILGREAAAWARQGQLMFLGPKRPRSVAFEGDRVVVFVHGWGAAGAVFEPMRCEVERALSVPTLDFTYGSMSSFSAITGTLAELLDRVAEGRRLDLVGHSLGGLIARWYVQELGGARHVDRIVTLATPHAGTASARIAPGPLRSALLPKSAVVRRLAAGRHRAAGVAHTALVAGADLMISPPSSAAAIADADVRWFDDLGHNGMLYDREVTEVVVQALSATDALEQTG